MKDKKWDKKWVEITIKFHDESRTNEALLELVKPFVDALNNWGTDFSWHFFREPEIRLRFYAKGFLIELIKENMLKRFHEFWEWKPELYKEIYFSNHGKQGEDYNGEADFYGESAWEFCYKRWEAGSNLALALLSSKGEKTLPFHYTRDIHLFENQLGFELSDAITILLKWTATLMKCDNEKYKEFYPQLYELINKTTMSSKIEGI